MISARDNDKPNVTLTLKNDEKSVYIGDTVTLVCNIDGKITDLTYLFFRGDDRKFWTEFKATKENSYTIKSVTQFDSGVYRCDVYSGNPPYVLQSSNPVTLTVQVRTARLEVISRGPDGQIFEGDKVSLTCQVNGHLVEWTFELWKIREENPNETRKENTFTFSPVTLSHRGRYSCRAKKGDLHSEFSASVQLNVLELFSKPTLTVQPNASVWEMDSVDMSCQSESKVTGTRLTYRFYRENMTVIQGKLENVFRITFAVKNNSGSYWCEVGSEEEKTEKKRSDPVQVTVREYPKATLTIRNDSKNAYIGDMVTLDCSIEGSFTGWRYIWYKGNLTNWGNWIKDATGNAYTFPSVTLSESGEYWCSAFRDVSPTHPLHLGGYDSPRHSRSSNVVTLIVKAMNVTLEPSPSRSVKEGDPLNLTCIWGGKQSFPSKLTFSFLQNNVTVEHNRESPVLSITWVEKRHGGSYMCATELPRGRKTYSKTIEIEVLKGFPLTTVLVSVGLALFLLLLLLLLFVCGRTRGSTFTEGKKARRKEKKMDVITPNRGAVQIEPLNKEEENMEITYSELVGLPKEKKKGGPSVNSSAATLYSEVKIHKDKSTASSDKDVLYANLAKEKSKKKQGRMPIVSDALYSNVTLNSPSDDSRATSHTAKKK